MPPCGPRGPGTSAARVTRVARITRRTVTAKPGRPSCCRIRRHRGVVMRVLVAGATGVIGRRLVPLLAAVGHEVVALARPRRGSWPAVRSSSSPSTSGTAASTPSSASSTRTRCPACPPNSRSPTPTPPRTSSSVIHGAPPRATHHRAVPALPDGGRRTQRPRPRRHQAVRRVAGELGALDRELPADSTDADRGMRWLAVWRPVQFQQAIVARLAPSTPVADASEHATDPRARR
jgi:NAD-dependent epimerase/dehydratase family protein